MKSARERRETFALLRDGLRGNDRRRVGDCSTDVPGRSVEAGAGNRRDGRVRGADDRVLHRATLRAAAERDGGVGDRHRAAVRGAAGLRVRGSAIVRPAVELFPAGPGDVPLRVDPDRTTLSQNMTRPRILRTLFLALTFS